MATVHSKAGPGKNRSRKVRVSKRRPARNPKKAPSRPKASLAPAVLPATTARLARAEANASATIRVQARLKEFLNAEMHNLEKAESLLRCLWFAMESVDLSEHGAPNFPDVAEVAADLIQRSRADLYDLYDGRMPEPLMAVLRVER